MRRVWFRAAVLAGLLLPGTLLPVSQLHATTTASAPTMASRLAAVGVAKSMNYYPSNAGWSSMWTNFDPARVNTDLARVATLGADNVRVIVFPQTFGYPTPAATYTERLRTVIDLAAVHGLTVKVTLFDWWSGYSDVANSIAWANAVLAPYVNDPRVIAVELKNEFQPNDTSAVAWVRQVIPAIRTTAPAMPLTLSVDGGTGAAGMAQIKTLLASTPLDYYDFHFYGASERSLAEIRRAQAAVAPAPMVIGETGASTLTGTDGHQGAYLARVFRAAREAGTGSVSPWTLNDFSPGAIPPNSAVSTQPAQYKFGLHRTDGAPKFAASVVTTAWTTGTTPNSILNLSFEAAAIDSPWRQHLPEAGTAVITTESARTGTQSARFSGTTRTPSGLPSLVTSPITPVQVGYRWRAEAYARAVAATGTTEIALSWFDINGQWIGQNTSNRLPSGNSSWTKLVVETVAPAGAAGVQLHLKSGDNTGTVWFDDVAVS
ncbi:cellulase family glycosylhydrolase [Actinoplanes sp. NEAU-A12]|uniref:Cellulase family glycosylhydrolase n=1 Tax=Actinoplanes sandaracinus TaxID=3045177 RepID=A0ABT6WGP6_9ACTN|nr:cellulase family glycosylhydrolase [Actinoplanes sandaracinus]MDI6098894.1 cellulase family glycosylhydrolase [Actinoplanes sandaracinus]